MNIASFVKDAYGLPYLPGSSLKGAIRTAFAYGEICKDVNKWNNIRSMIKSEVPERPKDKSYLRKPESKIQNRLFYTLQRDVDNKKCRQRLFFRHTNRRQQTPFSGKNYTVSENRCTLERKQKQDQCPARSAKTRYNCRIRSRNRYGLRQNACQ